MTSNQCQALFRLVIERKIDRPTNAQIKAETEMAREPKKA